MIDSSGLKSSIKGFRIRWNKELRLSQTQKQQLKKDLQGMSEKILLAMNCAKEEESRNEIAEMRLPLPAHAHLHAYLTVEYCNDAWHLILETYNDCIGEIMCADAKCIQMLKSSDVEEEAL